MKNSKKNSHYLHQPDWDRYTGDRERRVFSAHVGEIYRLVEKGELEQAALKWTRTSLAMREKLQRLFIEVEDPLVIAQNPRTDVLLMYLREVSKLLYVCMDNDVLQPTWRAANERWKEEKMELDV